MKEGREPKNEEPQIDPEQQNEEKIWDRVDNLRKTDNPYDDSIRDLAVEHGNTREAEREGLKAIDVNIEELEKKEKEKQLSQEDENKLKKIRKYINERAEDFSTKGLETMEAQKMKWTDDLTGLRNKNAYLAEVPQMLAMEKRDGKNCSMLVIDFDHFKWVNDEFGHDAGDQALKRMAELLNESVRSSDIVFRYGGEEFVIFLPATDALGAKKLAEKIRTKIAGEKFTIKYKEGGEEKEAILHKTISIGCAGTDQFKKEWNEYNSGTAQKFFENIFKAADDAVLFSKRNGRNRVTLYGENFKKENLIKQLIISPIKSLFGKILKIFGEK